MEILRMLASPLSATPSLRAKVELESNQLDWFGAEWVEIDEPVGFLVPQMKRRRQLLRLDQVNHVLYYDQYRKVIRIQDMGLVTAVDEVSSDGHHSCWMSIQDLSTCQVWVVHFASLQRLAAWVELLRAMARATKSAALISNVVLANAQCPQQIRSSPLSNNHETILEMHPEQISEPDKKLQ